jgi:hypothetical protein
MAKTKTPKFDISAHVSSSGVGTHPDALLFNAPVGTANAQVFPSEEETSALKLRFGSLIPADTLVLLHRTSYWSRSPLNELLNEALLQYFEGKEESRQPLPERERIKRKLPTA